MDWNEHSENLPYIPNRYPYTCTKSVVSPSPSVVDNLNVISYNVNDRQITLDLQWTPPSTPNGILDAYNICIGAEPLEPGEDVQPHTSHFCGSLSVSQQDLVSVQLSINFFDSFM